MMARRPIPLPLTVLEEDLPAASSPATNITGRVALFRDVHADAVRLDEAMRWIGHGGALHAFGIPT